MAPPIRVAVQPQPQRQPQPQHATDAQTRDAVLRSEELGVDPVRVRDRLGALNPAPTREVPVLVGGGGERTALRLMAGHRATIGRGRGDIEHSAAAPPAL